MCYIFIRNDIVARNRLKVIEITGTDQIADMLTKQLLTEAFQKHYRKMGLGYS